MAINNILQEGKDIRELSFKCDLDILETKYKKWGNSVEEIIKQNNVDMLGKIEKELLYINNRFSEEQNKKTIRQNIESVLSILESLTFKTNKDTKGNSSLDSESALKVIRMILNNFYKYYKTMYIDEVHGKSTIKHDDLKKVRIGNEYDVQRMLYSIIVPIFPLARMEVADDDGSGTIRYDIFIEEYDVTIEVKCTRSSMNVRKLREEIGSDAFHYNTKNIFFFIYDKEAIIKNTESFIDAHNRKQDEFGKSVETVIIQPIIL